MSEKNSWIWNALSGIGNVAKETTKAYGALSDNLYNKAAGLSGYFRDQAKESESLKGKMANKTVEELYKSYIAGLDPLSAGEIALDKVGASWEEVEDVSNPENYITAGAKEYKSAEDPEEEMPTWASSNEDLEDTIYEEGVLDGLLETVTVVPSRGIGYMAGIATNMATSFIPAAVTTTGALANNIDRVSEQGYNPKYQSV